MGSLNDFNDRFRRERQEMDKDHEQTRKLVSWIFKGTMIGGIVLGLATLVCMILAMLALAEFAF